MKTIKLLQVAMLSAAVLFSSCNKDETLSGSTAGEEVRVSFSTQLPAPASPTKATQEVIAEVDGYHLRYILEVWTTGSGAQLYNRQVVSAATDKTASFEAKFISGQTYDILLWADYTKDGGNGSGGDLNADLHYLTPNLKTVTKNGDAACAGAFDKNAYKTRDAFYAYKQITVSSDMQETLTLNRAVAQMNIYMTDFDQVAAAFQPDNAYVEIQAPQTLDLASGTTSSQKIEYAASVSVDATTPSNAKAFTGYYFASSGKSDLVNFTASFRQGDAILTSYELSNIPLQRNYRTNIIGNLLTKTGKISVDIDPEFLSPDISQTIVEVQTVTALQTALNSGAKHIVLTEDPGENSEILIPQTYTRTTDSVSLSLPAVTGTLTVKYDPEQTGGAVLGNLILSCTQAEELIIDAPSTSVTLNGTSYTAVEASTADNTLTIDSDVTVQQLTLKKGNVIIYGTVNAIVKNNGYTGTVIRGIASSEDMARAAADAISDYEYLLVEKPASGIDGNGAVFTKRMIVTANAEMRNFTINNSTASPAFKPAADDLTVQLSNVVLNQSASGRAVEINDALSNITFSLTNSSLIIPNAKQYGVAVVNANNISITLDATHIAPQKEIMGSSEIDYTEEQITAFTKRIDARSMAVANSKNVKVNIRNNSVLEGSAYALYTQNSDYITINVDQSTLDGRAALEIANTYKAAQDNKSIYNITRSKLIGRNYFGGPTEVFATIVFYNTDTRIAENNLVYVSNSEIHCFNNPQTATNWQYAADMRSPKYNLLSLQGVRIVDHSERLDYVVQIQDEANVFKSVDVVIEGKQGASILNPSE